MHVPSSAASSGNAHQQKEHTALRDAVLAAGATVLDATFKGVPLGGSVPLDELGATGWNVARGDLTLPVVTLSRQPLHNNILTMATFAERHGALLAPHGKTTMSPQLFLQQLDAGAWAITASTPGQVAVMRKFGVERIFLANELVDAGALRWIAGELSDPDFDFYCLVDDHDSVALMDRALDGVAHEVRMKVLVEVGIPGGRTGSRSRADAVRTAEAVVASRHLALVGVECYEGLAARGDTPEELAAVDAMLDEVRALLEELVDLGLLERSGPLVSAGGSAYFDRVVDRLGGEQSWPVSAQLVLRSGCYISHDAGRYHRISPLDGRRSERETLELRDSLQAWAMVLSRPEPNLAILGAGRRDVPFDIDLPVLQRRHRVGSESASLEGRGTVTKLMDQHAFVDIDSDLDLAPGDIVSLGLSHPCGAFDKSRLVPIIDAEGTVVDGILTFF